MRLKINHPKEKERARKREAVSQELPTEGGKRALRVLGTDGVMKKHRVKTERDGAGRG